VGEHVAAPDEVDRRVGGGERLHDAQPERHEGCDVRFRAGELRQRRRALVDVQLDGVDPEHPEAEPSRELDGMRSSSAPDVQAL
jgi:hypothetical protein